MKRLLTVISLSFISVTSIFALSQKECERVAKEIIKFGAGRETEHGMHGLSERQMDACLGHKQKPIPRAKKKHTPKKEKKNVTKKARTSKKYKTKKNKY